MAVSVDTVYQRVLAILNKEQRGYLTPQEFNLFANQAQLDIFEQYFYDINQFGRLPGNSTEFSDMLNILNEKINIFEYSTSLAYSIPLGVFPPPSDLYRLGTITYNNTTTSKSLYPEPNTIVTTVTPVEAERLNYNEYLYITQSPYTKPSNSRPVFTVNKNGYKVYGNSALTEGVSCNYITTPPDVKWGYQIVYGEALYDSSSSVDFKLHGSEETELVIKILELTGLLIKDLGLYQVTSSIEAQNIQQEKS